MTPPAGPGESANQPARTARSKRERLLSPGFSLGKHVSRLVGLALAGLIVAAVYAAAASWSDLWIVPVYILIANFAEWAVHSRPMHRPLVPRIMFKNHTLVHHRVFHAESMPIDGWRQLDLVMMPWFTITIFYTAIVPAAFGVAEVWGRPTAGIFALTAILTFLLYEGMHLLYHLPVETLRRMRLWENRAFRLLFEHHRHHHRPSRMRFVNFNISLPLMDFLLRTRETEAQWLARRATQKADSEVRKTDPSVLSTEEKSAEREAATPADYTSSEHDAA